MPHSTVARNVAHSARWITVSCCLLVSNHMPRRLQQSEICCLKQFELHFFEINSDIVHQNKLFFVSWSPPQNIILLPCNAKLTNFVSLPKDLRNVRWIRKPLRFQRKMSWTWFGFQSLKIFKPTKMAVLSWYLINSGCSDLSGVLMQYVSELKFYASKQELFRSSIVAQFHMGNSEWRLPVNSKL